MLTFEHFPVLIVAARIVALAFAQITDQVIVTLRIAIEFGNGCAPNKDVLITQKTTALTTANINVPIAHRLRSSAPSIGHLSVAYLST